MAKPKPTSGRIWRKPREEGYVVTLPSGNVARLRPVALDGVLASGDIPDLLTPIVASMLFKDRDENEKIDVGPDLAVNMVQLFDIVARTSFLEPRVVDDPQEDDEIAPADLSTEDKGWVFNLAVQPARILAGFPERQAQGLGPVPDGEDDGEPAE